MSSQEKNKLGKIDKNCWYNLGNVYIAAKEDVSKKVTFHNSVRLDVNYRRILLKIATYGV